MVWPFDEVAALLAGINFFAGNLFANLGGTIGGLVGGVSNYANQLQFTVANNANAFLFQSKEFNNQLTTGVTNTVQSHLNQASQLNAGLSSRLAELANVAFGDITALTGVASQAMFTAAQRAFDQSASLQTALVDKVQNHVTNSISSITGFVGDALNTLFGAAGGVFSGVSTVVNNLVAAVQASIASSQATAQFAITSVASTARDVATAGVQNIASLTGFMANQTQQALTSSIAAVSSLVGAAGAAVTQVVGQTLRATDSLISGVSDVLGDVAGRVGADLTKVADRLSPLKVSGLEELLRPAWDLVASLQAPVSTQESETDLAALDALSKGEWTPDVFHFLFGDRWTDHARSSVGMNLFLRGWLLKLGPERMIDRFAGIEAEKAAINYQVAFPWAPFSTAEAIAAYRAGLIDKDTARLSIQATGMRDEKAETVINSSFAPGSVGEIVAAWRRGMISEQEADDAMFRLGILPAWAIRIRQLSEIIPPVSDLITMAVREVFSPEISGPMGQFEEFPEGVLPHAEKQGISEEWFRNYWAAHWNLPSATQGFEMFQRNIIKDTDLTRLLRALDVMPFWRDKLIQLAYNPLTRVDIRRMHQVGVLTEEEVYGAYRDIGYDDVNARRLTDFTIQLNANPEDANEAELEKLTRANIVTFYRDGILSRDKARELLAAVGVGADAAELYLADADQREEIEARKAEIDLIMAMAEAGTLTFEEAQDKLNALGLATIEVQKALNKLVKAQTKKVKLPSQDDAAKMFEEDIIPEALYRDTLSRLGFSALWVDAYVALSLRKRGSGAKSS